MWDLIISTIVFFIAAWYLTVIWMRGIGNGMMRGVLVLSLASLVSWGTGEAVDWIQSPQPASQTSKDLSQRLKAAG